MHTISDITYTTRAGENFTGILAAPDGDGKVPGILYITAIWGVDASARDITAAFADDGFLVSTPDIFWRQHPGPTEDREIAQARYAAYEFEQGCKDIQDLIAHLRDHPRCNGKVAMLGICFGGRYAHVSAARGEIDAAASYHGTKMDLHLDMTRDITCPVSHHLGSEDAAIPMDVVAKIQEAYAGVPSAEIVVHEGAEHNFSMPHKPAYNPTVAKSARDSVLACFRSM